MKRCLTPFPQARLAAAILAVLALAAAGCGSSSPALRVPGGDASQGAELIGAYGCGSCHELAGIDGADGRVGPPLRDFADRRYIAGQLPNNLDNLLRWLQDPQKVEPGTVMPDLGLGKPQARDIAAYLYSH
jgi:cytochrome c2